MKIPDLAELTEAEKVALTVGADYSLTRGVPRLGVPAILLVDGPHGLRRQHETARYQPTSRPATCFPTASALAATWDVALIEEVGVALGREARAESVSVLLGPGANIKRTPLCGRNFEYFSEDPYLSSRLAASWIQGVQSTGVGASLKHFAANNIEARRYSVDSLVDERALREIYLASFEYAVRSAQPATVMAAYNQLNGRFCTDNPTLLTAILRGEWGFEGAVVSDWGATNGRASCIASGLDLSMPGGPGSGDAEVTAALRDGRLPAAALDRAAGAMLRLIARTADARTPGHTYDADQHHALARRVAAAGTVLLRNEDGALPLPPGATVAVLGAFARLPRYQGAGSSRITPHRVDNPHDALVSVLGPDRVRYADGYRRNDDSTVDDVLLADAVAAAEGTDVVVVFVGLPERDEVEGLDRADLDLPPAHDALVEAVAARHPRVVVVVQAGAPVVLPWRERVSAILHSYLGGQAGGSATADVLCGRFDPGGRLAETFPVHLADNPVHGAPFGPRQTEYRESLYVGYRWFDSADIEVAYPFGHGLSYTTFDWTQASAEVDGTAVDVRVTVTNTGERAGSEVVQVYVHDVASTAFRPAQELKGFAKLHLGPGESRSVTIQLDSRAFAFWDVTRHDWTIQPGEFEIRIGASSRDIRHRLPVTIEAPAPLGGEPVAGPAVYHNVHRWTAFSREAFAELYRRPLPDNARDHRGTYTSNTPIADIAHPLARALQRVLGWGARRAVPSEPGSPTRLLVERSIEEMTPRMLSMYLGDLGDRIGRALVRIANRR